MPIFLTDTAVIGILFLSSFLILDVNPLKLLFLAPFLFPIPLFFSCFFFSFAPPLSRPTITPFFPLLESLNFFIIPIVLGSFGGPGLCQSLLLFHKERVEEKGKETANEGAKGTKKEIVRKRTFRM